MRWLILSLLALVSPLFWIAPAQIALAQSERPESIDPAPDHVIAVVPRSWPPQFNVDENDRPIGFAIDVMDRVAESLDLEVEYTIPVPVLGKLAEKLVLKRNEQEADLWMQNIKDRLEQHWLSCVVPVESWLRAALRGEP